MQIPVSPFDNALAVDQMEVGYSTLLARPVVNDTTHGSNKTQALALDGKAHPRIITYIPPISVHPANYI